VAEAGGAIRANGSLESIFSLSPERIPTDWLKFKNPDAPAVRREAEEDWGRNSAIELYSQECQARSKSGRASLKEAMTEPQSERGDNGASTEGGYDGPQPNLRA
jgi:hypothetical protein